MHKTSRINWKDYVENYEYSTQKHFLFGIENINVLDNCKLLDLGFGGGMDLPDSENLLQGNGKLSRYVEIKTKEDIKSEGLTTLLNEAFNKFKIRNGK